MKKSILIISAIFIAISSYAQDSTKTLKNKQKEAAIAFSNFDNFGLTYKFGNSKSLWRLNALFISGQNSDRKRDSLDFEQSSLGFKIQLGKEFRKSVTEKLELRYGVDLAFEYNQNKTDRNDKSIANNDKLNESITYSPGINFVIGFNYLLNQNIAIGLELMPAITYDFGTLTYASYGHETEYDTSGLRYGLSNNSALLTLAYRF